MRFAIIISAMLCATSALSASLHVRDADTIVVDGTAVRLNGVDAPELKTAAGAVTPENVLV